VFTGQNGPDDCRDRQSEQSPGQQIPEEMDFVFQSCVKDVRTPENIAAGGGNARESCKHPEALPKGTAHNG
jgi:hypothetical protein